MNPDLLGEYTLIFQACFNKLHNIYLLTHVLTAVYQKKNPFFRKKLVWRKKVKVGHFKTKIVKPIINQKTLASTTTTTKTTEKPTDNNVIHLAHPVTQPYGEFLNMTIGDNPRLLSLFTIVTFPNDACMSGSGGNGTCYRYIG